MWFAGAAGALLALVLVRAPSARAEGSAPSGTKRVFVLSSFGRDFSPYSQVDSAFRTELSRGLGAPIDFLEVTLGTHDLEPLDENVIVRYVNALCAGHPPDLVVTNGPLAAWFRQGHRNELLPGVPAIYGALEERWARGLTLFPEETAVSSSVNLGAIMESILRVLPETKEVFIVFGASAIERRWLKELEREWEPFRQRVHVTDLAGLSFDEVLRRTAALPPRSVIFFGLMLRDTAGVPYEHESALKRLHATANAPIFGWSSATLGRGAVGGPLMPVETLGREMARSAERILRGEPPASIPAKTISFEGPVYDARELARWGIDESRLPPGSVVRFRPPSFMQLYRGRVLAAAAVLVLQTVAIAALVVGHRRRRQAEKETARLRSELAHVGRVTVLGQLSSSLAHELAQPLGAILRNAEAAELFLSTEPPDLDEVRAIVSDIKSDDGRARDVIERMRGLLRNRELTLVPLDLTALVAGVLGLVRPDARARGVRIESTVAPALPTVRGDAVHLQQVLLNLFVNAMEAMETTPSDERVLSVSVRATDDRLVEIVVSDSGSGIAGEATSRLFEPFYTTKPEGMGMGLPICRTLVEAHDGRLRTEVAAGRGATFVVSLPAAEVPA